MLSPISALATPVQVLVADAYSDGTVGFILEDCNGRYANVCIDGRKGSPTQHRLFDRARHPAKPGAVLIDLGAPEEGLIVPLISQWLDSATPRRLRLSEYGWEFVRDALLRLGEPSERTGA